MIELAVIVVCLFLNALLAGAETAFIAVSKPSLKELAKKGNEKASLLLKLREAPERTLSIIQIGITFVGALAAAFGGAGAEEIITPWMKNQFGLGEVLSETISILIVVLPLTFVTVVFGELVPKTVALKRPLFFSFRTAPSLHAISRIFDPLVTAFEISTKIIVGFFTKKHFLHAELEEIEASADVDILSPVNRQYVVNLLKIEKTTLKEIMVPWNEVVFVKAKDSIEDVENLLIASGHTRVPVVKENEVIGIINAKEFFALKKAYRSDWISILRPAFKISENSTLIVTLPLMQQKHAHLAVIYRGSQKVGITTMEGIFEEIIGDIYDEDDDGTLKHMLDSMHFKARRT